MFNTTQPNNARTEFTDLKNYHLVCHINQYADLQLYINCCFGSPINKFADL
jgi:hypothetical protein